MYSNDEKIGKEEERIKETEKVFGYVFDKPTLLNIYKFFHNGYLEKFEFPIASGKESIVFCASKENKFFAVKVYKISASNFKNVREYASSRWGIGKISSKRKLMNEWAFREFDNLQKARLAGVPVPKPIKVYGNVLQMQYIGTKTSPAKQLKDFFVDRKVAENIILDIRKLYQKAGIVHGDLSEYNYLYHRKRAYMIDLGQAVSVEDPYHLTVLRRDINNIIRFLNKFELEFSEEKILKFIVGGSDAFY